MAKGVKHPSPFRNKLGFDQPLERFISTKPSEVDALIERGKTKKSPGRRQSAKCPNASATKRTSPEKK
jgi:hypothetical protein